MSKRGFTLIEMLIVVGIIAILMGILLVSSSSSIEKARTAKCAANMKNLAAACFNYMMSDPGGNFPPASDMLGLKRDAKTKKVGYSKGKGAAWLSSADRGTSYPLSSPNYPPSMSFAADEEDTLYAVTNGCLWSAIGGNREVLVCPSFAEACRNKGVLHPGWSYQMNAFFGCPESKNWFFTASPPRKQMSTIPRPDLVLLFAEIPGYINTRGSGNVQGGGGSAGGDGMAPLPPENLTGGNGTEECDGCLKTNTYGKRQESMGFNHRRGKDIIGHVVFTDGHVEGIAAPKNGQFYELTEWLCRGVDIVLDRNGNYQCGFDSIEEGLRQKKQNEEQ